MARMTLIIRAIRGLLLLGIVAAAHHAQLFSAGHLAGHEHAAFGSVFHWTEVDRDFVACLQSRPRPSSASEEIRTHTLEAVRIRAAFVVGHVDPEPDMRIGPI